MPDWRDTKLTAGALAAYLVGMLALGGTIVGVQHWVDNRIDDRVEPLEQELKQMQQSRTRQYGEIKAMLEEMNR